MKLFEKIRDVMRTILYAVTFRLLFKLIRLIFRALISFLYAGFFYLFFYLLLGVVLYLICGFKPVFWDTQTKLYALGFAFWTIVSVATALTKLIKKMEENRAKREHERQ